MSTDIQKQNVYDAEHAYVIYMDLAAESESGMVQAKIAGSTMTVSMDRKFSDLAGVQRYVDAITASPYINQKFPSIAGVKIAVDPRLESRSYYRNMNHQITLAGSKKSGRWAMREFVVLHELAHAATRHIGGHGPEFAAAFVELVEFAISPEVAYALRMSMYEAGCKIA